MIAPKRNFQVHNLRAILVISFFLLLAVMVSILPVKGQGGDFSLSANPTIVNGTTNAPALSAITVTRTEGFDGDVVLTSVITPSTGLSCNLTPGDVAAPPSPQTSVLACTSATGGDFTVTVNGVAGGLSHSTQPITFHIVPPGLGFTLSSTPPSVTCTQGQIMNTIITVTDRGGFNGMVTLSSTVDKTSGLSAMLSPTSVIGPGTSGLALTCTTAGTYKVTVIGTSNGLTPVSITVPVTVTQGQQQGTFGITAIPSSILVIQGCGNVSMITLTSHGFTGELTLKAEVSPANSGVTAQLSSTQVSLSVDQSETVILTVSADQNAVSGSYTVTVTAMNGSGSLTQSTVVQVTVVPNSCNAGEHEGCASDDEDESVDHSDQNGTPCHDSNNPGAVHGIGNCANEDRDDHHRVQCGCPSAQPGREKEHSDGAIENEHEDHEQNCETSCQHQDSEGMEGFPAECSGSSIVNPDSDPSLVNSVIAPDQHLDPFF